MVWNARIGLASFLALFLVSGCKKKQQDVPVPPKPQQTTATPEVPSPPAPASGESSPPQPVSEQQERALRRYNENTWLVQQAMQVGPSDETQSAAVTKLVKAAAPDWDHANPTHAEIRGPEIAARLHPWIEMAGKQDAAKQAAALLIADRIVVMEEEDGNLEPQDSEKAATRGDASGKPPKSPAQVELERLGAGFTYELASERFRYALNWLQHAYELAPDGRAGELAFLALMERGFDTSVNCAMGSDQFREVIRRGAAYLKGKRSGDVEARVHFMMGGAYRDIVALASGLQDDNYADPNNYKSEASEARTKAIAEYRAGLALDDKSEPSRIARQHLGSLEAGEAPHDARFYCQVLD